MASLGFLSEGVCAADRSRKSVFAATAKAGESGPQASRELSSFTLDAHTLLLKTGAAIIARPANLGEFSELHQAWKRDILDVLPHAGPEAIVPWWDSFLRSGRHCSRANHRSAVALDDHNIKMAPIITMIFFIEASSNHTVCPATENAIGKNPHAGAPWSCHA
jgi:hypothetical protein